MCHCDPIRGYVCDSHGGWHSIPPQPKRVITSAAATGIMDRPQVDKMAVGEIARKIKADLDHLHGECHTRQSAGLDSSEQWAEARGLFQAYKMLADLLGWQN